jgi:hypothetical protein
VTGLEEVAAQTDGSRRSGAKPAVAVGLEEVGGRVDGSCAKLWLLVVFYKIWLKFKKFMKCCQIYSKTR